ncbi:MAG: UDP-N-acetylmuramate--L-alanine ligase [Clostridiales bacterium]|nr:UDP-N-acetylmuramate--L-alanine ligase [Clostridiales bacterium]
MDKILLNNKKVKIHFTGIGGVSMSGLACFLSEQGLIVSGSDINKNENFSKLSELGITVYSKHSASYAKNADAVVYTSAVGQSNPEIKFAKRKNIPLIKRSELLGRIMEEYKRSIAVSGSHGKTTATAMIADMLILSNMNPTVFLGGESSSFGNYRLGEKDLIVAEACEYQRNFLDLRPDISVILNVDNDHTDCYKNEQEIVNAFKTFSKDTLCLINADDKHADEFFNQSTVTFGIENRANFSAKNLSYNGKGYSFTVCAYDRPVGRIKLSLIGRHNVYNALATFALSQVLNVPFLVVKDALENFGGIKRRAEYLGKIKEVECFADYAHHPREILATLNAFRDLGEDFAVVFQPHTYSRTKSLMVDFVKVLEKEKTIIYKTYPAREKFDREGSESVLFEKIFEKNRQAMLALNKDELEEKIGQIDDKVKKIIFLGAGDIYEISKEIINKDKS